MEFGWTAKAPALHKRHMLNSFALAGALMMSTPGTAGGIARSFLSLAMAALNLNITISGLQRGQHI